MNPVVHFEMPYRDGQRAARFYHDTFGWQAQFMGPEMGDYVLMVTADRDSNPEAPRGAINGGLFPFKPDWPMQYPSVVIGVEDIQAAIARVKQGGGELLGEPMMIPSVGLYVSFVDTEGNRNSMLQPTMG